ncbi:MAG: MG2 domain-containing protein [Candidatus Aminicenantales bacterium]
MLRHGLVFLQVDTNLPDSKWNRYLEALLQITELAITAKFSAENIIVWVTELKTGLPAAGVKIEIRDRANNIKWQGETDASGRAEAPGWKKMGLSLSERSYEAPKLWVFVRPGEDVAFISSGWEFNVDPYRFDIPFNWLPEPVRFQGYIFTERGIYRAGEEVHIKGIIRENNKGQWKIPTSLSLQAEITDPLGKGVFRGQVSLDEFGSFDFDFKTNGRERKRFGNGHAGGHSDRSRPPINCQPDPDFGSPGRIPYWPSSLNQFLKKRRNNFNGSNHLLTRRPTLSWPQS